MERHNNKLALYCVVITCILLIYFLSYGVLRLTKTAVRRTWVEGQLIITKENPSGDSYWIMATDVGHGRSFSRYNAKADLITILFYPCWQLELRIRGKYYYNVEKL